MDISNYLQIKNLQRQKSISVAQEKKEEFCKLYPEFKKLEDEIANKYLQKAINSIENTGQSPKIDREIKDLIKKKNDILSSKSLTTKAFEPVFNCSKCKDTGMVETKLCACLLGMMARSKRRDYALANRLESENFKSFNMSLFEGNAREAMKQNRTRALRFVKSFPASHNLLFYGGTGSGKTFLCNCIANEILEMGHIVLYHSAVSLFHLLKENLSFTADDSVKQAYDELKNADLLIIDDLGDPPPDFMKAELFEVLNTRIVMGKSIIITTNLGPDDIKEIYENRINSRLLDFVIMKFYGEDLRQKI